MDIGKNNKVYFEQLNISKKKIMRYFNARYNSVIDDFCYILYTF